MWTDLALRLLSPTPYGRHHPSSDSHPYTTKGPSRPLRQRCATTKERRHPLVPSFDSNINWIRSARLSIKHHDNYNAVIIEGPIAFPEWQQTPSVRRLLVVRQLVPL